MGKASCKESNEPVEVKTPEAAVTHPELKSFAQLMFELGQQGSMLQEIPNHYINNIADKLNDAQAIFNMRPIDHEIARDALLRDGKLTLVPSQFIQLEPIIAGNKSLLPRISLDVDFTKEPATLQINVISFLIADDKLKAIPIRFEAPEGPGDGKHDYFHAQFTPILGRALAVPGCPAWLPDSQLSFPLDASNAIEALIAAIIHLYTAKQLFTMPSPAIKEHAQKMRLGRLYEKRFQA